ncbi:MAG: TetR/AcrR family transcriptional regulator [Pseudomonadota bacterium]
MGVEERREREREQRKKDILDAARKLLVEQGLQATSVNQIAKACELGIGTIYFYFKNKEEIFAALQEEGLDILYGQVAAAGKKAGTLDGKLRAAAMAYLDFSRDCRDYFDVINYFITSPSTFFPSALMMRIHSRGSSVLSLVESIVAEGTRQDLFLEPRPRRYAIFFWASLHGLITIRKMGKDTILENEDYQDFYGYSVEKLIRSILKTSS